MKSIISFICVLFLGTIVKAQCINGVSTNFEAPTNNSLPIDNLNPLGDTRYLNYFNFYPLTVGGNLEDYDLTNMLFGGVQLSEMDNIWSDQVIPYYNYINKQPVPISKNGWELLLLNVGRFPDDITINGSNESFQALPYIVIYNRYSGLLRVFANIGTDLVVGNGPDAIEIILQHPNGYAMSGVLRLHEGFDRALDINAKVQVAKSIAKATNTQRQWFSSDFQLAYDPCVCYYPSELQFFFNQIKEEDITLYGRSLTLTDDLINPQLQVNPSDFLTSFDNTTIVPQGGILAYKGVLPLINAYEERLVKYKNDLIAIGRQNEIVEQNLGAIRMLKYMLTIVITQGINGGDIGAFGAVENESWYATVMERYGGFITTANGLFDETQILEIIKNIIGGETKTYIEQNFERVPLPEEPSKPQRVTFSEMRFTGKVIDSKEKAGPTFYNPGTYGSDGTGSPILSTMYNYPIYNEVVGVVAVIETPKVLIADKTYADGTNEELQTSVYDEATQLIYGVNYQSFTNTTQMKLLNEIKYTINPVLDVKSVNVKAAWSIKASEKVINVNGQPWNSFLDPLYTVNLFSKKLNVSKFDPIYRTNNLNYEGPINQYWAPNYTYNGDISTKKFDLSTPYMPLDQFMPLKIGAALKSEYISFTGSEPHQFLIPGSSYGVGIDFDTIYLKLMVDVEYETIGSDGKLNTVTQMLTIPIEKENWAYTYERDEEQNLIYSSHLGGPNLALDGNLHQTWDTGVMPELLEIKTSNFNGSIVQGCWLASGSTNYLCTALDKIRITGDLTIAPGYSVQVIAGNQIEVLNEASIPSEAILEIINFLPSTNLDYQVQGEYVKNFCKGELTNGPEYQANVIDTRIAHIAPLNNSADQLNLQHASLNLKLFPNPSNGNFFISLDNSLLMQNLLITDMLGRDVSFDLVFNSNGIFELTLINSSPGMYNVSIQTNEGNIIKRIIVN